MADKVIAFFVEGPTEIEFYKAVVKYAHDVMQTQFTCSFEWQNMKGIGNYKKDSIRRFNKIKKKYPDSDIYAVLCIDTDVFELEKKPPFDKVAVKESLLDEGAKSVCYVEAKQSIEDWFLSDLDGVISYLKLPKGTKRPAGNGQVALKSLFRSKNKIYVKGGKTEGFIEKLNIPKILASNCKAIRAACKLIGMDCKKICNKD